MSQINFVEEFRAIMETCRKESLTARSRLLWIALFYLANDRARKNEQTGTWDWPEDFFPVNNAELFTHCPLEKRAILDARNRLKQMGVIDFKAGDNAMKPAKYKIKYLTGGQWCKNAPQHAPQEVPQHAPQEVPQHAPQEVPYYINQDIGLNKERYTHDNQVISTTRARDRLSSTYLSESGSLERCRYDDGFLTSAKARSAVAQRILDQFFGDVDTDNAHGILCQYLANGMPPEIAEDCVEHYRSMSLWLSHLHRIADQYAEQREKLEKDRLAQVIGSARAADWMIRQDERYQRFGDADE